MKENKRIEQIYVEHIGWIYSKESDNCDDIEVFFVNGKMALGCWYRKGNREFNGKYVIEVRYEQTNNQLN